MKISCVFCGKSSGKLVFFGQYIIAHRKCGRKAFEDIYDSKHIKGYKRIPNLWK
jgi:hypothetical protein